jgi:hypothetical protein
MIYHGSPPPGVCPQRFGSQALLLWFLQIHDVAHITFSDLAISTGPYDPCEADQITPGSSTCDLTLGIKFLKYPTSHHLTKI